VSTLTNLLSGLSATIGAGLLGNLINDRVGQLWSARKEAQKLTQELEAAALRSNDISIVGNYLYDNIGSTRVSNYVRDDAVHEKVTRALDSILAFLGPEEVTITPEEEEEAEAVNPSAESRERPEPGLSADTEMGKALQEIRYGETWNGLARLRRHIEAQLRKIAPDVLADSNISAGRLLDLMVRRELILPGPAKQLRYAITVANAGIHGEDVDVNQAEAAWNLASTALASLDMPTSEHNDSG
jgi:hypothetical protein